jgi:hypothetical protein
VETFFIWILFILGPSLAAFAWFIWYSGGPKNSDEGSSWNNGSGLSKRQSPQ